MINCVPLPSNSCYKDFVKDKLNIEILLKLSKEKYDYQFTSWYIIFL